MGSGFILGAIVDVTVSTLREKIFGARDLTTQEVVDHFRGNLRLAEAYLNGLIDWRGNPVPYIMARRGSRAS